MFILGLVLFLVDVLSYETDMQVSVVYILVVICILVFP